MCSFCVTRTNPTHQVSDPTQPTTSGKIWTQPDTTNNSAYGLVVVYFYTQHFSRKLTFSQPSVNLFMFFTDRALNALM